MSLDLVPAPHGGALANEFQQSDGFGSYNMVFRHIYQILLEEEDEREGNWVSQEALVATERTFYDALTNKAASPSRHENEVDIDSSTFAQFMKGAEEGRKFLPDISLFFGGRGSQERSEERNNPGEDNGEEEVARRAKQPATDEDEELLTLEFDRILLYGQAADGEIKHNKGKNIGGGVDFESLLSKCAHAIMHNDQSSAMDMLQRIRVSSSLTGNGTARMASYFADALEARLTGFTTKEVSSFIPAFPGSPSDMLMVVHLFLSILPFSAITIFFSLKHIMKAAKNATKLHVIDFGILYGFKWLLFIHQLASRPGGPPKLRITAVDPPLPGFRPNRRMEITQRFLENCATRFGVPFKFDAVVKKWEALDINDFKMHDDEILTVNSAIRFHQLSEEGMELQNPRDAIFRLIREMNPAVFVFGVTDSGHGASFFSVRFREALYHYSSIFDMLDTVLPNDMRARRLYEDILGREIMNCIAIEGLERIERPERARIWHQRIIRAGFHQLPLNAELLKAAKAKMKFRYRKGYFVQDDQGWLLQGWKGRSLNAMSAWKPL